MNTKTKMADTRIAQPITPETQENQSPNNGTVEAVDQTKQPRSTNEAALQTALLALGKAVDFITSKPGEPAQSPVLQNKEPRKGQQDTRSWNWTNEGIAIDQHPAFRLGSQALGLTESQAFAQLNEVADIVRMTIEYMGSSDPEHVHNFLQYFMRHTSARSVWSIKRELEKRIQEEEGGE